MQYWGKPIEFLSMNNEVIDTESEDQLLPGNQAALDNTCESIIILSIILHVIEQHV